MSDAEEDQKFGEEDEEEEGEEEDENEEEEEDAEEVDDGPDFNPFSDEEEEEIQHIGDVDDDPGPHEDGVCRVCFQFIPATEPIRFGSIHAGCLRCGICTIPIGDPTKKIRAVLKGGWRYCAECEALRTLEMQLLTLRKQWNVDHMDKVKPTEMPAMRFASLREAVAAVAMPGEVNDVIAALAPTVTEADSPWWLNIKEVLISIPVRRRVLTRLVNLTKFVSYLGTPVWKPTREELIEKLRGFEQALIGFISAYQARPKEGPSATHWYKLYNLAVYLCKHVYITARDSLEGAKSLPEMQRFKAMFPVLLRMGPTKLRPFDLSAPAPTNRDLQVLPLDTVRLILGYTDGPSLVHCRCVSKWWKTIADDEEIWRHVYQREYGVRKPATSTWRDSYAFIHKWLKIYDPERRLVHRLTEADFEDPAAFPIWLSRGVFRETLAPNFRIPDPIPGFQHPLSRPEMVLGLKLDLGIMKTMSDLEAITDNSPILRERRLLRFLFKRYHKFMTLKAAYPDRTLIPTIDIYLVWRSHAFRPAIYEADCKRIFGASIPITSNLDIADDVQFYRGVKETADLWEKHFPRSDFCFLPQAETITEQRMKYKALMFIRGAFDMGFKELQNPWLEEYDMADDASGSDMIEVMEKEEKTEPPFQNPFSITIEDVLTDGVWGRCYQRYDSMLNFLPFNECQEFICSKGMRSYEKFLYLQRKHPNVDLIPNFLIQFAWRAHMLNSAAYCKDMIRIFGKVLSPPVWYDKSYSLAFDRTRELWEQEYGTTMDIDVLIADFAQEKGQPPPTMEDAAVILEAKKRLLAAPANISSVFFKHNFGNAASIKDSIERKLCTFSYTGPYYDIQKNFLCKTCQDDGTMGEDDGLCVTCGEICHAGHTLIAAEANEAGGDSFFCDCGPSGRCKAMLGP